MDERAEFVKNKEIWSIYNKINFYSIRAKIDESFKKYSYQDFKNHMNIICHSSFRILYVFYGVLQFFATWAGLVKIFHHDNIVIQSASLILGFFPFIGTFSGLYGAYIGWDWSLSYSLFVFITPYFIVNGPILLIAFFDIYKDIKRWEMEKKQNNSE